MPARRSQPPRILVASHHRDVALELQQIAERRGYAVRRAYTGVQLLDLRFTGDTDVIVLDESLPDIEALDASRSLRADPHVGPGVPILLLSADQLTAARHHAALRAGVWQYLAHPFNPEELGARLDRFVFLKRDADRAREQSPVTDETGLYTVRGLALRAQELGLQAFHHAEPLACVALAPITSRGSNAGAVDLVAHVLRATGRRSDAIGRVGPGEFAVVAPGTDRVGAVLLAERVSRALHAAAPGRAAGAVPSLRAGYDAVANARYTPVEPKNLLGRATSALRTAKAAGDREWIQAFPTG
jgi:PleD family two-component response regulator